MRAAVFVDAGYLFAQGSVLLTGSKQRRELLTLDVAEVSKALHAAVTDLSDQPMLRIYWYDATVLGRLTREQLALADAPSIKIRLGQVNTAGDQKGVDSLIVTDLMELARNRAITDAVLLGGDEDIRIGVVLAQQFGVRVHLIGIHPARANQSPYLRQEADTTVEWDAPIVQRFLAYVPPVTPSAALTAAVAGHLDALIEPLITNLSSAQISLLKANFASGGQVPAEYDRMLLRAGRTHFGQATLLPPEKALLRSAFVRLLQAR